MFLTHRASRPGTSASTPNVRSLVTAGSISRTRLAAAVAGLLLSGVAFGQVVYPPGFVWNRQTDWTERPAGDGGTSNGNPDDDQAGRPVWVYENAAPPPDFLSIGSANPWYIADPAVTYFKCTWETSWFGFFTGWNRGHNKVPITNRDEHYAYQGFYYEETTWQRWVNVSSCRTILAITGTCHLQWGGNSNTYAADVVLLVKRASGAHDVLFEQSFPHPSPGNGLDFAVDLHGVGVGPGDSIVRTVRMHQKGSDISNFVVWTDALTYTLEANAPPVSPQPESVSVCLGGQATMTAGSLAPGNHTFQWRRAGNPLSNGPTGTGSTISGVNSPTLTIDGISAFDVGQYDCLVGDLCGSVASNAATLSICGADLNCDTVVDDADFSIFVIAYNLLDCADPTMPANCPADLNGDGLVDDADFSLFVVAYNRLLCS